MEQYGFLSNSGADQTTQKTEQRRRNRTATTTTAAKRGYPPLLTTSLVRPGTAGLQKVMKRFNFVKRRVDEGRRFVVEAEEIGEENQYYLKVSRANSRLVVSLVPMNELEMNSCDGHDDGDGDENICMDDDEVVECEEEKMAFPFFESVSEPASVKSIM